MPTEKATTEEKEGRRRVRAVKTVEASSGTPNAGDDEAQRGLTAAKGRPTPSRRRLEEEEEDEGNLLQRTSGGLAEYFRGVRTEVGKVTWPTREDARRLTIIVLITLIISSIILGTISLAFTELFRLGLDNPIILIVFMVVAVGAGLIYYRLHSRRAQTY
ncbi:preprotein translocase subunit SecE [Anaerolineae bacterium CFX9]|nr:preprotein translocase subunit SecE [Oscillatoria laete-virens]MDK3158886.1 preprotein translocase subunit SecE [Kamptonema cortianum]MDL1899421.1 preprotein translocase subunit SecE [Anaerolineae bacterium CFX9]MDL5052878.1 preprotein translocase subunit SecE [Oscillatoria laete-virens NRMC-F 0139]